MLDASETGRYYVHNKQRKAGDNMKRLFNAGRIIGEKLISQRDGGIGKITNAYEEDGRLWAVIDDDYEIDVSSCEVVWNVTNGDHYVRIA
jgi:hypothetical protein